MIKTTLARQDGKVIRNEGTSGVTLTGARVGDGMDTLIEHDVASPEEWREMVCCLLCMLDEKAGEAFVASCFARYAEETGKKFMSEGNGRKLVMIRGGGR